MSNCICKDRFGDVSLPKAKGKTCSVLCVEKGYDSGSATGLGSIGGFLGGVDPYQVGQTVNDGINFGLGLFGRDPLGNGGQGPGYNPTPGPPAKKSPLPWIVGGVVLISAIAVVVYVSKRSKA